MTLGGAEKKEQARPKARVIPWAGDALLGELFADYKFAAWDKKALEGSTLCDITFQGAPLRWDSQDYERFPPWARLDEIEKHLAGCKITDLLRRGTQAFIDSLVPSPRVDIIAETARAEQASLDTPAAPTSSWIE